MIILVIYHIHIDTAILSTSGIILIFNLSFNSKFSFSKFIARLADELESAKADAAVIERLDKNILEVTKSLEACKPAMRRGR